jgi:hypothetical protein
LASLQNRVGANGSVKLNSNTLKSESAKDTSSPGVGRDFFVIDTFDAFAEGKRSGVDERVISLAAPGSKV